MAVERKIEVLEFLMSRWSTETCTFTASSGEFGPNLEDVVMLTSLPVFGDAQVANLNFVEGASRERHNAIMSFLSKTKYGASNKSTYLSGPSILRMAMKRITLAVGRLPSLLTKLPCLPQHPRKMGCMHSFFLWKYRLPKEGDWP